MSDPGSLVGAVSLTLQMLQGLKWYYSHFRSYHDDIEAVLSRAERIESILSVLQKPVEKFGRDDYELFAEVKNCIRVCEEARVRLKEHQEKISTPEYRQDVLIKKLVLVKKRFAYPFRKETLEDLQKQLDRMLESLQVVLHALHLDTATQHRDQLAKIGTATLNEVARIRRTQSYSIEFLEDVKQQIDQQFNQQSQKLDHLTTAIEGLYQHHRTLPAQSELQDSCDEYLDVVESTKKTLEGCTQAMNRHQVSTRLFSTSKDSIAKLMFLNAQDQYNHDHDTNSAVLLVMDSLLRLLKDGRANVYDITPQGSTIAHASMVSIGMIVSRTDAMWANELLYNTVQSLSEMQVDMNERDNRYRTPLDYLFDRVLTMSRNWDKIALRLCQESPYFSKLKELEYSISVNSIDTKFSFYRIIITGGAHLYDCEISPVMQAIIKRSESDLRIALKNVEQQTEDWQIDLLGAISWTPGLRLLLDYGVDPAYNPAHWITPLDEAIRPDTWHYVIVSSDLDIVQDVASTLHQAFQAQRMKPMYLKRNQRPSYIIDPYDLYMDITSVSISNEMKVKGMQELFAAGFTDLYSKDSDKISLTWGYVASSCWDATNIYCISWLCSKGLKLDAMHPIFKTRSLHLIAEKAVLYTRHTNNTTSRTIDYVCDDSGQPTDEKHLVLHEILSTDLSTAPNMPLTLDEITDIQYTEQKDAQLLEDLLREFEMAWEAYEGSLIEFIDGYWSPRMEEVKRLRDAGSENNLERLQEAGVVFYGPEPHRIEKSKLPKYGSLDWVRYRVDKIMDGTYRVDNRTDWLWI
ncbi:hypothetical protein N0V90_007105 [Kalmusia sp. IMI 367209]|nr:hypothetical protein N0V90_007105 [Kalmusia sp. IMI 367209]